MWDLVLQLGIEPLPSALAAGSLNHWATREVPWGSNFGFHVPGFSWKKSSSFNFFFFFFVLHPLSQSKSTRPSETRKATHCDPRCHTQRMQYSGSLWGQCRAGYGQLPPMTASSNAADPGFPGHSPWGWLFGVTVNSSRLFNDLMWIFIDSSPSTTRLLSEHLR